MKKQAFAFDSLVVIGSAAFLIRLVVVLFLYQDQLAPERDFFHFGWETGRVARSLALGEGFASPFHEPSGPTAMVLPMYALLLAGLFKIFGVYSSGAALAILSLNALFSALTCVPIARIADRIYGRRVATGAAWGWAFFPYAIDFAAERVWGDCLNALLLSWIFLGFLRLKEDFSSRACFRLGLLSGLAMLNNSTLLLVVPVLGAWLFYLRFKTESRNFQAAALLLAGLALPIAPWCWRNYQTFDRFMPLRSNFWLELRVGNTGDLSDVVPDWVHPATNRSEMEEYCRLGEIEYMNAKRAQVLAFVFQHPWQFLSLTARRIAFVWTGFFSFHPSYLKTEPFAIPNIFFCSVLTFLTFVGLGRSLPRQRNEMVPFLLLFATYPGIYYFTHPTMDYRHPIDPLMVILCARGLADMRVREFIRLSQLRVNPIR